LARATKIFGKLNAQIGVGAAIDEQRDNVLSTNGIRLGVPDLMSIRNADATSVISSQSYSIRRSTGVFADISLDYGRFVTLNASIRRDATSTLPTSTAIRPTNNNAFIYPGANISFVFSELLKIKNFDRLKTLILVKFASALRVQDATCRLTKSSPICNHS
jgi:TonB dependent receptor